MSVFVMKLVNCSLREACAYHDLLLEKAWVFGSLDTMIVMYFIRSNRKARGKYTPRKEFVLRHRILCRRESF